MRTNVVLLVVWIFFIVLALVIGDKFLLGLAVAGLALNLAWWLW